MAGAAVLILCTAVAEDCSVYLLWGHTPMTHHRDMYQSCRLPIPNSGLIRSIPKSMNTECVLSSNIMDPYKYVIMMRHSKYVNYKGGGNSRVFYIGKWRQHLAITVCYVHTWKYMFWFQVLTAWTGSTGACTIKYLNTRDKDFHVTTTIWVHTGDESRQLYSSLSCFVSSAVLLVPHSNNIWHTGLVDDLFPVTLLY